MGSIQKNTLHLPVIDISPDNPDAASQLLDAAARYGFVFIENNDAGIPPDSISQLFDLSREFFASSLEVKEEVSIRSNAAGKNHGWLSQGVEKLDPSTQKRPDVKEAFNIGEPIDGLVHEQPIPRPLQPHVRTIIDFQNACNALCRRVLEQFAIALEIRKDWFSRRHYDVPERQQQQQQQQQQQSGSVFRMLYYPHTADYEEGVDIRAGAHSDYGSITLLFQQRGQPGLEIRTPSGEWAAVPVDPVGDDGGSTMDGDDARGDGDRALPILVNIGDLLEDWTGGLLKSTVHRVVFPRGGSGAHEDRYSMAYFCHPLDDAELVPVPSRLVEEHVARKGETSTTTTKDGKVLTARDHLMERLAATYKIK